MPTCACCKAKDRSKNQAMCRRCFQWICEECQNIRTVLCSVPVPVDITGLPAVLTGLIEEYRGSLPCTYKPKGQVKELQCKNCGDKDFIIDPETLLCHWCGIKSRHALTIWDIPCKDCGERTRWVSPVTFRCHPCNKKFWDNTLNLDNVSYYIIH